MPLSDDELLARAKQGDRDALTRLLQKFGPRVRATLNINPCWRPLLDVDDVMQVTYFEAFRQIAQFRSAAAAFLPWLRRIAQNNLRDAVDWLSRKQRPQPKQRLFPPPGADSVLWLSELVTESGTTPSGHLAAEETRRILEREVANLPRDYRHVLQRLYFEGQPVRVVAREMGRTPGAVHLLRIRAVDWLRDRFGSGSRLLGETA